MRLFMFIIILLFFSQSGKAQIEAHWIDTTQYSASEKAYFFTNRKPKKTDDGSVAFRNRWTRQTDNLYFSVIDYESDSILLKYQATKICEKHEYPTEAVENNMEMHLKSIRYLSLMHGEPRLCHSFITRQNDRLTGLPMILPFFSICWKTFLQTLPFLPNILMM